MCTGITFVQKFEFKTFGFVDLIPYELTNKWACLFC